MLPMPKADEVTTIFVVGFPDDFLEREFQNMFTFCRGFQASSLKRPSPAPATPTEEQPPVEGINHHAADIPAIDQPDSAAPTNGPTHGATGGAQDSDAEGNSHSPTQPSTTALNGTTQSRKQIIGFAKFNTRQDALDAIDVLSGRKIDQEKGCILKAEMAKKNLHTKRTASNLNMNENNNYSFNGFALATGSLSSGVSAPPGIASNYPDPWTFPSSLMMDPEKQNGNLSASLGSDFFESYKPEQRKSFSGVPEMPARRSMAQVLSMNYDGMFQPPSPPHEQPQPFFARSNSSNPMALGGFKQPQRSISEMNIMNATSPTSMMPAPPMMARNTIPADQNPPCNTLYVGNLPPNAQEEELRKLFSRARGYKRLCFKPKPGTGPMCFVEFEDVMCATRALNDLYGSLLSNSVKGGIRLSYSKNPLGVRQNSVPAVPPLKVVTNFTSDFTRAASINGPFSAGASPNETLFRSQSISGPFSANAEGGFPGRAVLGKKLGKGTLLQTLRGEYDKKL